jgi:hypothetical protein
MFRRGHHSDGPLVRLRAQPALVQDWRRFSDDKRTSAGWYLLEDGTIGCPGSREEIRFPTLEEATAAFVVRELDHAAGLWWEGHRTRPGPAAASTT